MRRRQGRKTEEGEGVRERKKEEEEERRGGKEGARLFSFSFFPPIGIRSPFWALTYQLVDSI